eukprot:TRINITY_DN20724_c0_g1_i1.p1 TRINITY_DN20724_c0_g1~~TRINITY_DN20724_c0_g1_i1.p1  ORF type:complete len:416 (-),score=31.85 TRINITY_DN20724_c0_g1_i1:35-1282(-)
MYFIKRRIRQLRFYSFFFLMIRRPPRSTLSSSSAASDVYKRQILIRFPNARETERWVGVLSPSMQSYQWRRFVKSLPSVDVLNVFVARIFFENREQAELQRILTKKINKKLAEVDLPKTLAGSTIRVHSVSPGPELPLISNVSTLSYNSSGELGFDFDLWYRGGFILQLTLDLKVLNKTDIPSLVVTIGVKEVKGRLHVSVSPPPANKMWLGFHEPPDVSLDFRQELAEASKSPLLQLVLKLIPDLSVLITDLVKVELFEDMTLPNLDDFPLPNVEDTPPTSPREAPAANNDGPAPTTSQLTTSGALKDSTRLTFKSTESMSIPTPKADPSCAAASSSSLHSHHHRVLSSSSTVCEGTHGSKARLVPREELHTRNKNHDSEGGGRGGSSTKGNEDALTGPAPSTKPYPKYSQPQW